MGVQESPSCLIICFQSGASVEGVPTTPHKGSSSKGEGEIVMSQRSLMEFSSLEEDGYDKASDSDVGMNDDSASEICHSQLGQPTFR